MNSIYAGIGSRETPPEILKLMTRLAGAMEQQGWLLRSGGARGADAAFEAGVTNPAHRAIFLPDDYFNGRRAGPGGYYNAQALPGWTGALDTVVQHHPSQTYQQAAREMITTGEIPLQTVTDLQQRFGPQTDRYNRPLTPQQQAEKLAFAVSLHARNAMQILGPNLDRPANLVVAWTPGGAMKGGTSQAIRMAQDYGIPVRNLGNAEALSRAQAFLNQ